METSCVCFKSRKLKLKFINILPFDGYRIFGDKGFNSVGDRQGKLPADG